MQVHKKEIVHTFAGESEKYIITYKGVHTPDFMMRVML